MAQRETIDPLSLIGKQLFEPVKPALHHDLIALFGIKGIRESVARFNPATGEKINRLRKSYANYPAKLGLAGKNKQVVHGDAMGISMAFLTRIDEEEYLTGPNGKSVLKAGFSGIDGDARYGTTEGLNDKLSAAMLFEKEALPPTVEGSWGEALGHEKPRANKKPQAIKKVNGPNQATPSRPAMSAAPTRVTTPKPSTPALNRPQRKTAGVKRGYEDEVGDNDQLYHDGASDGDTSDGGSLSQQRKKQKRVISNNAPPPPPPPSSYNPASIHQRH